MKRVVQSELLDELTPDNPRATRSRCDLRRVNSWMRGHAIMASALQGSANGHVPKRIVDLGAGDGDFLLHVARQLSPSWKEMNVTLLDRQKIVEAQTLTEFAKLRWRAEAVVGDVFEWTRASASQSAEIVIANLLLHHFTEAQLAELFCAVAGRARLFIAVEPRRALWPLFCSRLLWAIGCNAVTRHDAKVSVRAGFAAGELSALWPVADGWRLIERPAGFFSHLFVAQRIGE